MSQMDRRLQALERAHNGGQQPGGGVVVIYDAATGLPLKPVPEGDSALIWLPAKDSYRGQHEADRAEAEHP